MRLRIHSKASPVLRATVVTRPYTSPPSPCNMAHSTGILFRNRISVKIMGVILGLYWGYIGIMEKEMENYYLGFRVYSPWPWGCIMEIQAW